MRDAVLDDDRAYVNRRVEIAGVAEVADCAAIPCLYYGNKVEPSGEFKNVSAYLERLQARPSVARVLKEAEPYFDFFPKE